MVESEARELSEDMMLEGGDGRPCRDSNRCFRRSSGSPEKAAKEPRELGTKDNSGVEKAVLDVGEADLRAAYSLTEKQGELRRC